MTFSLVFDLDGTLIDSSLGILSALSLSLCEHGYEHVHVDSTHVGPPIHSVFSKLLPSEPNLCVGQLCDSFRNHYDNSEYLRFKPYEGVPEVLEELVRNDFRLFIVTNKRASPTKKIIDRLEWNCYFEFIYSLDMCGSHGATKVNSLSNLLSSFNLFPSQTPYLGDRLDDYLSANAVSMPFFFAEWGYASCHELSGFSHINRVASPSSLISTSFLRNFQ